MAANRYIRLKMGHRGNTTAEYALIGVLALVASMAVLNMLGGNLNQVFGGMNTGIQDQAKNAAGVNTAQASQATQYKATAMSNAVGNALMNGSTQSSTVQVTAANGDTLLGLFATLTHSVFNTPATTMNDSQIQAMERDMSNQTFAIADLERQMQDLLTYAGNDPTKFMKTTLNYQGKQVPAITLAIGIQSQVVKLTDMMNQLDDSAADAADKAKLAALVEKISGDAAAIYSKSLDLQSQYQATVAKEQIAKANQALTEAAVTAEPDTKAQKEAEANSAMQTAQTAQVLATTSADVSTQAAEKAKAAGSSPDTAPTTAAATTTKSAGVICDTAAGKTLPSECVP